MTLIQEEEMIGGGNGIGNLNQRCGNETLDVLIGGQWERTMGE